MMESRAVTNDRYCIAVYSIEFLVMIEGGSSAPLFFIVKRFCKDLLNLEGTSNQPPKGLNCLILPRGVHLASLGHNNFPKLME